MRIVSVSMTALIMSTGMAMAQSPLQTPEASVGTELGAGEGRRQQRLQQEGGVDRLERREQRQQERAQRQESQVDRVERGEQRQEERSAPRLEQRQEERAAPRLETREREPVQIERDRAQRIERRFDERAVVRERNRGPRIRFGFGPDVFVRTLPLQYRTVIVSGRPCRITITRRVRANGRIVTTERRKCPGRPEIVIRTRSR